MHALEFQFDSVISDRSMIMQRIYLLFVALKNKKEVIGWEFFLSRFDTLCLEAQLDLDNTVDASCVTGKVKIQLFRVALTTSQTESNLVFLPAD